MSAPLPAREEMRVLAAGSAQIALGAALGRTLTLQIECWKLAELGWPPTPGGTPSLLGERT